MAQPIRHCLSACVTFSTRQRAPGCVLEPNKSHSVATLHAPPGSSQGASTERFGFQAPLPQGGLHRTSREPSSLRSSPAHCPGLLCAPSPPLQTPAAQHVLPPAAMHPPPPNFLLQGDSWRWGVRVWCCLAICSRSGNNLKLNPQLFGSLL